MKTAPKTNTTSRAHRMMGVKVVRASISAQAERKRHDTIRKSGEEQSHHGPDKDEAQFLHNVIKGRAAGAYSPASYANFGFGCSLEAGVTGAALNCAFTFATAFSAVRPCFWRR